MKSYKIASPEAAERYKAEVGAKVELEINEEEERAVIAAGWLEHVTTKAAKDDKN